MLTTEAYLDRKWKSLPVLRATLEGRTAPSDGRFFSTDETRISRLENLLAVVALTIEHKNAVRECARAGDLMAVHEEITRLAGELRDVAGWLVYVSGTVDELHAFIEEHPEQGDKGPGLFHGDDYCGTSGFDRREDAERWAQDVRQMLTAQAKT